MKRFNQKGVTTIVVIITVSMYAIVSSYNHKRIIQGYKEKITTYKNTLTKEIQEDFVKIGVSGTVMRNGVLADANGYAIITFFGE